MGLSSFRIDAICARFRWAHARLTGPSAPRGGMAHAHTTQSVAPLGTSLAAWVDGRQAGAVNPCMDSSFACPCTAQRYCLPDALHAPVLDVAVCRVCSLSLPLCTPPMHDLRCRLLRTLLCACQPNPADLHTDGPSCLICTASVSVSDMPFSLQNASWGDWKRSHPWGEMTSHDASGCRNSHSQLGVKAGCYS